MWLHRQILIFLGVLSLFSLSSATFSFPSFEWIKKLRTNQKDDGGSLKKDLDYSNGLNLQQPVVFPSDDENYKSKYRAERYNRKDESKLDYPKGQEVEEFHFRSKPDYPKGQEVEDFHFESKPDNHNGQEIEEINFGSKPDNPKGQEVEGFHFGSKPADHKGQEIEEISFGSKPNYPKGQEIEEFHFGAKPEKISKGQEIEEINFGSKPDDPKGQELEEFHFGAKPEKNSKGQEIEEINFGSKPGQEVEEFHFGSKSDDHKGQEIKEINFEAKPEYPKGQEVEEFHFGSKPGDDHKEQEFEEISFGSKPKNEHKGQEIEEINFGSEPDLPKGQEVEEFHFGSKPDNHEGQEVEEISFGSKPGHPEGQKVEEFHFGSKPEEYKEQGIEEINFGSKPKDDHKGQEIEEINFGSEPDLPKGQEVEEFHFGPKPDDPKGQEIEEINFGSKLDNSKGQEEEEFHFGSKPEKDPNGQEVEEINFGSKPDLPEGQELEEFHFGSKPEDQNGQEIEEINFGSKPNHSIGQETVEYNFEPKPTTDHKGQEIEELNFVPISESPIGQELEEYHFGNKSEKEPTEQEVEEINFGSKPRDPKEYNTTTIHLGSKPIDSQNQVVEETYFLPKDNETSGGHWTDTFLTATEAEAICTPHCQNGGTCIAPNQCACTTNYHGAQCQFESKSCLNHPPISQNSQAHCNSSACIVECFDGYTFPNGVSSVTIVCHQGEWTIEKNLWDSLPDCKPSCYPPCINGGTCLDLNVCQCPREYAGPQCQYEISVCDGQKLNFNGFYTCRGESDKVTCTISCPEGFNSDIPIASEYVCHYSSGKFSPEPIPKCIFGKNVEVIKVSSSTHIIHGGFDSFESSKTVSHKGIAKPFNYGVPRECITWKGTHYKTFDGRIFSFESGCSFILAQDFVENSLRIVIENPTCHMASCNKTLKIFYQDKEYMLSYKDKIPVLLIDGHIKAVPLQLYDFSVEQRRNHILINLQEIDVNLRWNTQDRLSIRVNSNMWNKINGLCGIFNYDPNDDYYVSDGFVTQDLLPFVDSWKNENAEEADNCHDPTLIIEDTCKNESKSDYCHRVFTDSRFGSCCSEDKIQPYIEACNRDVCRCGQSCACDTVHEFVEACKKFLVSEGIPDTTSTWREIAECPVACPPGKIYSFCGPSIEATCGSSEVADLAKYSECVEGCFCPDGMVLSNGTCIKKENCLCQWKKQNYKNGELIFKDCNTCTCKGGKWMCTHMNCGSRCSVTGGSHYLTFDGRRYDFMGQCAYYLLKSDNYSIVLEDSPCSEDFAELSRSFIQESSSCTKSVLIRYGNDEIKLRKDKEVLLNGTEATYPFATTNDVVVRSGSSIYLIVTLPDGVEIWWDGNANVYIDIPGNHERTTGGLCGTFNENQRDDFITPEGDIEQSEIAFAEKWKTDETCTEIVDPLKAHSCETNGKIKEIAEKQCDKLKQSIFQECHQYVDVEPFYKNCLHEVCSCQKKVKSCFCPIFADYANECSKHGVEVLWRKELRECGLHCPPGQTYQPCGDSCTRSCRDISLMKANCNSKCAEGCNCPDGLTLNSNGQCIPIHNCPCFHQNLKYKPGDHLVMYSHDYPEYCICENATWTCRRATKLEVDRDYENSNVKCNETMHEEYTTCEPAEPKTCKNMHDKAKQSSRICFPGCVCKKGYVWDSIGKMCVNASECPCHHGGRSYADGEKIQEDCNTCTCKNGRWFCTEKQCPAICTAWGDSHFKTFDGRIYDFQGSCDFVLAAGSLSDHDAFVINLQIVPCGSTGVSCAKSVTLKVGNSQREEIVFRKSSPQSVPRGLERIIIREAGLFTFAEVFDLGVTVQWDKGTRVYVKLDSKWKNKVKGLCGNFNDNALDDFRSSSSGETSEVSPAAFADSWRLQSYCPESYSITDTCAHRPHRRPWAVKKCSVLKSEVFESCHSEVSFEPYLERCIIDACGCDEGGDCECMCTAISAYAEECTLKGVPIKWRTQKFCPLQCENDNSQYNPCISTCPPKSCDNQYQHSSLLRVCSESSCIEGCDRPHCPDGHVLAHSSSNRCIPISSCKTVCLTVNNVTYLEGDLMESDDCHSCFCSHHKKTCIGKPCLEDSTTSPVFETSSIESDVVTTLPPFTESVCPQGHIWDDCIVSCRHICSYWKAKVQNRSQCLFGDECLSGCKPIELKCSGGMFLRDENTCVHKKDCPCISTSNSMVKPGDVVEESECEKCQCLNNEYECTSVCTSPLHIQTTHSSFNFSRKVHVVTPRTEYWQEGNVTLMFLTTPKTVSTLCPSGQYDSLINEFTKFSASSQLDDESIKGTWRAEVDNGDQYLQVDLGKVEPVHAVNVAGVSGKYVTGYYLLYSVNGKKYTNVLNKDGGFEIFGGPFDGHHSAKQILPMPIEARYIRFHPFSWHEGIAMKVDVLGCKEPLIYTTPPTIIPSICNKGIGIGQKRFPKLQIIVTSSKPTTGPDFIGFDNEKGWQPLTNSKFEWVQFDFGEHVNFTGIITKGVSISNDLFSSLANESWVERYKVEYSHDSLSWNPVLDEFGNEMIFMGNIDGETAKKNFFKRPIRAKSLKISPVKWHNNIALRLDLMGCYEPPPVEVEVTPPTKLEYVSCNICEGAFHNQSHESHVCNCIGEEWWDGSKCVSRPECPCFEGFTAYPVGTSFTTQKCEECTCRLYGIRHCTPKICDLCPDGHQRVHTASCGCICKPCEKNTRLCPTSNVCLEESLWCNGIEDCPDDEVSCTTPAPKVTPPPKLCKASCPPGYEIVYRNKTAGPAETGHMSSFGSSKMRTVKSNKSVKTYKSSKKSRKHGKQTKITECRPYDCVPSETKPIECSIPECPLNYVVIHKKEVKELEGACPLYGCEPIPEYANCTVSSRNIKTFDGAEYKYDICDHILAADDSGLWNVTMFKICSFTSPCVSSLLIHHGDHSLELHPHNRSIKFDSFSYADTQMELLNSKIIDFTLNPIGNSIIFTSNVFNFDVVYETNGNSRITVPAKMKGRLNGLCGLYNDDKSDDKTKPDGKLAKTTVEFGDSWVNPGAKECFESVCPIEVQNIAHEICLILRREPFSFCYKETDLELCIESYCNCFINNESRDECRCLTLADFATKCRSPDMFGWRVEYNCPSWCPSNLIHYDCYPYACEPTCGNEECAEPATDCYSGCFCPDGMIKKGDQCITLPECRDCVCSGMGDSTYLTFDGGLTFNGNCTYVATREKNPSGTPSFEVLITNGLCNGSDFMTCVEKMEIKVSEHSIKLFSLPNTEKKVKILIDGGEVSGEELKKIKTWAKIEQNLGASSVEVELPKEHVEIHYFYNRFAYTISLPSYYYSDKVEGLCGTCSRNGLEPEVVSPEIWQTDGDENCLIEPPNQCIPTPQHEKICRLMNDFRVFGQCLAFVDPTPFIDQCLALSCANGHICNSLEAYSQACRDVGICVNWRSEDFCPFTCPSDLQYNSCHSGCLITCEDYGEPVAFCPKPPIEGCFCPDNQILINGTCQSGKFCDYCDKDGPHYDGDEWEVDKCTNCTCHNHVVTCNKVECPAVDMSCEDDQVVLEEENEFECCPKHKCGCMPKDECPAVQIPTHGLSIGMEAVINETGCCPRVEIVCRQENCPLPPPCKTNYVQKVINSSNCCPEYSCEKPDNVCVYEPGMRTYKEHDRVEREEHREEIKQIGELWMDGPCKSCACIEKNGVAEALCVLTECPDLKDHEEFHEYELDFANNSKKCCPEVIRRNCKHDGHVYKVGDFWMPDERNPCKTMKCNQLANGQVVKETRMEICNKDCDYGWEYQDMEGKCCGHCVQTGCLEGGKIYKNGEVWFSNDQCAKSTCIQKDGHFSISTMMESCPSIEDCPKEDIYQDKCCLKCKIKSESKKICFPQPLPLEATIKLIREKKGRHGLCQNLHPIHNFTQCVGNCDSHTVFKPDTWSHDIVCKCCKPEEFSLMRVELKCKDGRDITKSITVPTKCTCMPCG